MMKNLILFILLLSICSCNIDLATNSDIELTNSNIDYPEEIIPAETVKRIFNVVNGDKSNFVEGYKLIIKKSYNQKYGKNVIRNFHGSIVNLGKATELYNIVPTDYKHAMLLHMQYAEVIKLDAVLHLCKSLESTDQGKHLLLKNRSLIKNLVDKRLEFIESYESLNNPTAEILESLDYYINYHLSMKN
jgi:hypothetical protein